MASRPTKKARTSDNAKDIVSLTSSWAQDPTGLFKFFGVITPKIYMTQDDDYQANVDFVHNVLGDDVAIHFDCPDFHQGCACQVGDSEALTNLDYGMKSAVLKCQQKVVAQQRGHRGFISRGNLKAIFDGDESFCPYGEDVDDTDSMSDSSTANFKCDGSPSAAEKAKVGLHMRNFVSKHDANIWHTLKIDTQQVARLFTEKGAHIDNFADFFAKHSKRAIVAVDVGAVRYPTVDDPFIKVFRYRVIVTNSCKRILWHQEDQHMLAQFIYIRKYKMSAKFMERFTPEIEKAVDKKFDEFLKLLES